MMKKSNIERGIDPLTALDLGNIRIVENWMNLYSLPLDKKCVKRSRSESGQAIVEVLVDTNINATILNGNPDWKSRLTGSATITFEISSD